MEELLSDTFHSEKELLQINNDFIDGIILQERRGAKVDI